MARKEIDRYTAHRIPSIDVFTMSKEKIDHHGKYVVKLDGVWQYATSSIENGFQEYISNPSKPDQNGINTKAKASKSLNLLKQNYEFDGIIDYSLDLRHLIDYCSDQRSIKTYFKSIKRKNLCLALVKVNFEKNTKDIREFFYRPEGFSITYDIEEKKEVISYVRYKRTASGAREGSCLFIAKDLYEHMNSWTNAGIDPIKAKHIDSVSWEAYIALTLSSIETDITLDPRQFLFIKDKETVIKCGNAFEITNTSNNDSLIQRYNIYSDTESDGTLTNKNKIWDGEGLIDDSLFSENDVLKQEHYSDRSMLLLRGKLFKACVFRTHIQKWFKDNGITDKTHKVSDLNGYTQAKKISDIKFIIPYSCLKFLKFKDIEESDETMIKNWITDIAGKRTIPMFGIIKADKKSKLMDGQKVFTTYQMLNTLGFDEKTALEFLQPTIETMTKLIGPGKEGSDYVKYYLDNLFFAPSTNYNAFGDESPNSSDTFKIFHYNELTASTLLKYDTYYYKTPHYKDIVKSLLSHIKKQVMDGRVLIDGVYATLFCNGIELLKCAIDKNYDPDSNTRISVKIDGTPQTLSVLKKTEIYSKRFPTNSNLLCARNPHITMGNYYLARNKRCIINNANKENVYDRYFVLSEEIVCVNAIDSDIMNTLNGCDFDSDTMLITNNHIMVNLLNQQISANGNKFRVPFNNVQSKTITPDDKTSESVFLSVVDDKLSNNLIGEIVNLSQRINSLIWMLAPLKNQKEEYSQWKKWDAKYGNILYQKGCCTLAVLSNIEIDSAKRSYRCNTKKELDKIQSLLGSDYKKLKAYTSWLTNKTSYTTPVLDEDDTLIGLKIVGLDPMGYIIKAITSAEEDARKNITKSSLSDYEFLSNLLKQFNIVETYSNCEDSLNSCLITLANCYDYLDAQNVASKENSHFKRNYVKDCMEIMQCCSMINNILCKETVSSSDLLWQLLNIIKNSSRLIKSSSIESSFTIVDMKSDEFKNSSKEERHDCPRALLWAALFLNHFGKDTYLTEFF